MLALRCDLNSSEEDFGIRVSESGLVYVLKKKSKSVSSKAPKRESNANANASEFEFVARFPKPVNETSAQCVFQEGVLFVAVEPRETGPA